MSASLVTRWPDGMATVREEIATAQQYDVPILLTGETGTGKGLVAKIIHDGSDRDKMVQINCAAIPDTLVESELFGAVEGAYTGAAYTRKGVFQRADGGTLFLDEIGDLSLPAQAKILQALDSGRVQQVGSARTTSVSVRVIAATNKDLLSLIVYGMFRADLLHRLTVFPIHLPPLRDRGDDVLLLADHFVDLYSTRHNLSVILSGDVRPSIAAYDWPGNVRELSNVIERAVLLARDDGVIRREHLPEYIASAHQDGETMQARVRRGLISHMAEYERDMIEWAIREVGGINSHGAKSNAARLLGLNRTTLVAKMKKHGVPLQ